MYLKQIFELPSSISWCENDYVYSIYIAEFWNSISGLALCTSAILQIIYHHPKHNIECKIQIYTFLVGIGTILFHSTLLYIWQLLDEIPMLLMVQSYIDYINFIHYQRTFDNKILKLQIYIITISYFINHSYQVFLFQIFFTIYVLILIYKLRTYYVFTKSSLWKITRKSNKNFLSNCIFSAKVFTVSLICWKFEHYFCSLYNDYNILQLHAIWHVLTSVGLFYINKALYNEQL